MKLKNIIKHVNKRMAKSKYIKLLSELTTLDKVQCYREFFSFTRNLKYLDLEKYAINLPDNKYCARVFMM